MTRTDFAALLETLHRLTRQEAVLAALDGPDAILSEALCRSPEGLNVTALLAGPQPILHPQDARQLMRLCAQCTLDEVLTALAACPHNPSPAMLAALVEQARRRDAMALYALQMLWRIAGEPELPDAMTLFAREEINPAQEALACRYVIDHLKEASAHG